MLPLHNGEFAAWKVGRIERKAFRLYGLAIPMETTSMDE